MYTEMLLLEKHLWITNAISIKSPMAIFHRNRKNNPKICMEPQTNPNSQSNHETEKQSWRYHTS